MYNAVDPSCTNCGKSVNHSSAHDCSIHYLHTHMYIRTNLVHTYMHTYIHTYIHTHIHTHTHTYTHVTFICMSTSVSGECKSSLRHLISPSFAATCNAVPPSWVRHQTSQRWVLCECLSDCVCMYWCTSVSECVFLMHKCVHVCVCVRVRVRVCLHGVRCSLLHSDRRAHPTSRSCLYAHIFCMHKRDL